jgi:hypothetical protein
MGREWIHLGHGPVNNDAMRVTFGSGWFAVFPPRRPASCAEPTPRTAAFLGTSRNGLRAHTRNRSAAMRTRADAGRAFDLYLPEGSGIIIRVPRRPLRWRMTPTKVRRQRRVLDKTSRPAGIESLEGMRAAAASSRSRSVAPTAWLLQSARRYVYRALRSHDMRSLQRHAPSFAPVPSSSESAQSIALADLCAAAGVCTRAGIWLS